MLYSVHYFVMKTKMTGFFQTAFYFGYTLMFCLGEGAPRGAAGSEEARLGWQPPRWLLLLLLYHTRRHASQDAQ